MLPDVVAPVEPLVPVLLVVEDEEGGTVLDEDEDGDEVLEPDAPMPDVEVEPELGALALPLTEPADDPMPDAVPEAVPVELQAASAATHAAVRRTFIMIHSILDVEHMRRTQDGPEHELSVPGAGLTRSCRSAWPRVGRCRA